MKLRIENILTKLQIIGRPQDPKSFDKNPGSFGGQHEKGYSLKYMQVVGGQSSSFREETILEKPFAEIEFICQILFASNLNIVISNC